MSHQSYGVPVARRVRGKSPAAQLQVALDQLAALAKVKRKDTESYVSELKAASIRVKALQWMISRKETKKFEQLEGDNEKLRTANASLKAEVERLTVLAARPATISDESSTTEKSITPFEDRVNKMLDAAINMAKNNRPKPSEPDSTAATTTTTVTPQLSPPRLRDFSPSKDFPWRAPEVNNDDNPSFRGPTWPKKEPSPQDKVIASVGEAPRASLPDKTTAEIDGVGLGERYAANQRLLEELRARKVSVTNAEESA